MDVAKHSPAFERAVARFDEENARDPNREGGEARELVYARRLAAWVARLAPDASEALQLAARCQHICRWMIPRASQPMTRAGYLRWRAELKEFHAAKAGKILHEAGYDEAMRLRVRDLNLKKNFPYDPEGQVLEDALCLVFLNFNLRNWRRGRRRTKLSTRCRKRGRRCRRRVGSGRWRCR